MSTLQAALSYLREGWAVLPVYWPIGEEHSWICSCWQGRACPHPCKHPVVYHPTKDPKLVEVWVQMWPAVNVAVATGRISGVGVVDIDTRHPGWRQGYMRLSFDLSRMGEPLRYVRTPSGGQHWYYPYGTTNGPIPSRTIAAGIDLKADGGFVVAPPSRGINGRYERISHPGRILAQG